MFSLKKLTEKNFHLKSSCQKISIEKKVFYEIKI